MKHYLTWPHGAADVNKIEINVMQVAVVSLYSVGKKIRKLNKSGWENSWDVWSWVVYSSAGTGDEIQNLASQATMFTISWQSCQQMSVSVVIVVQLGKTWHNLSEFKSLISNMFDKSQGGSNGSVSSLGVDWIFKPLTLEDNLCQARCLAL